MLGRVGRCVVVALGSAGCAVAAAPAASGRGPVERRIDALRARHPDIPLVQSAAETKVAQTLYEVGRFAEAADLWRALVRREPNVDRAGFEAYDWACCCALSGRLDEAVEGV